MQNGFSRSVFEKFKGGIHRESSTQSVPIESTRRDAKYSGQIGHEENHLPNVLVLDNNLVSFAKMKT